MDILIAELFGFAIAMFVVVRYVVPFIRKAMAAQQKAVAKQVEDAQRAHEELQSAQARCDEAVEQARNEAAQIRDRARAEAGYIADEVAERADQDVVRIHQRGDDQLTTARQQAVRELRRDVGQLAVRLAGRIVHEALADESRRSTTIDRFLDELDGMSQPEGGVTSAGTVQLMQGASRDSLSHARDSLDADLRDAGVEDTSALGDELFAVSDLLDRRRTLLRSLADPSIPSESRVKLVDTLFGARLSERGLGTLRGLVADRWSRPTDLLRAVEALAREAHFAVAEQQGSLDDVEDQLFRLGRILEGQPELAGLLSDPNTDPNRRVALLDALVADKLSGPTLQVLRHTVRSPRRRSIESLLEELTELVAARRGRSIAQVTAPLPLTGAQEERLGSLLSRVYGRDVSLQVEVDEAMLGGLVVEIGEDLIDGSVSAQLERAAQGLPQ